MSISKFYGFLAWFEVLASSRRSENREKGENLLRELISYLLDRGEGYIRLYQYYCSKKDYSSALCVIEDAYLIRHRLDPQFIPLVVLYCAKRLSRINRVPACIELLQLEYMKVPWVLHLLIPLC